MRDPEEMDLDLPDVHRSREEDALHEPETMDIAASVNSERSNEDPVRRVARLVIGLAPRPLLVPMCDLAEALETPPPGPSPGEMHPIDQAFYNETVAQRNRAWRKLADLEHRVMSEPLSRIEMLLVRYGGGTLSITYDPARREWGVIGVFGRGADDRPMTVHGIAGSIDQALDQALREARL